MHLYVLLPQYVGFVSTEFLNIFLLWLILTKASTRFGTYRYIMMSYAAFCVAYGIVEILTQPVIHLSGACMIVYVDSFLKFEKSISMVLLGLYCGSFGLCVCLLATQFLYRYVAVCRPQDMHHFQGYKLLRVYTFPLLISIFWFFTITVLLGASDVKAEYMRESINETYSEDTTKIGYFAVLYYYTNSSGSLVINWRDFAGAFLLCGIMQTCIIVMSVCGWKTYSNMKKAAIQMSERTRELNNQLFKTLVLQSAIPLCTMFGPVGTLYILPMFSISVGKLANVPSFYVGFYPALDALVAIFMIKDFRNIVLCKRIEKKPSSIAPATYHSSTYASHH